MSVLGEGREPRRRHLLALAKDSGLDPVWAGAVLDRMVTTAADLKRGAADLPIRRATVAAIVAAVERNRKRVG